MTRDSSSTPVIMGLVLIIAVEKPEIVIGYGIFGLMMFCVSRTALFCLCLQDRRKA